ncbi:uncharacterized protein B0H64DRAFT_401699 [Chaetomium fimeti]|uniref:Uncharacterized protein n=1 Tax=Chaetomium fimeti TaxID=1854472 RepID=A0AAE0HEB6_9PEZI|nr:hypothetical protein B0H64DRAFT_401699 [Chaetomium fimeti]
MSSVSSPFRKGPYLRCARLSCGQAPPASSQVGAPLVDTAPMQLESAPIRKQPVRCRARERRACTPRPAGVCVLVQGSEAGPRQWWERSDPELCKMSGCSEGGGAAPTVVPAPDRPHSILFSDLEDIARYQPVRQRGDSGVCHTSPQLRTSVTTSIVSPGPRRSMLHPRPSCPDCPSSCQIHLNVSRGSEPGLAREVTSSLQLPAIFLSCCSWYEVLPFIWPRWEWDCGGCGVIVRRAIAGSSTASRPSQICKFSFSPALHHCIGAYVKLSGIDMGACKYGLREKFHCRNQQAGGMRELGRYVTE